MSTMELFGGILMFLMGILMFLMGILMFLMAAAVLASIFKDITEMAEKWKIGTNVQIGASARYAELMPDDMPPVKTHRIQLHRHRGVSIEEITLERP